MKKTIYTIQAKYPLGEFEFVECGEMTFDEAAQKAAKYLSPTVLSSPNCAGEAMSVRIKEIGHATYTYIPQFDD